ITNGTTALNGTQRLGVQADANIEIEVDTQDLVISQQIISNTAGDIVLLASDAANGNIIQSADTGSVDATLGNVTMTANNGDISLRLVTASARVTLNAVNGQVSNNNLALVNVIADELYVSVDSAIGEVAVASFTDPTNIQRLTTQVASEIDLTCGNTCDIAIDN